jgi:NAD(P)-dependent dehydrogenase (short-subunit alcohol dehydrogenase family)
MRFQGKAVLVTGGGSGIGLAAATAFLREGARVAIGEISAAHAGEATAIARKEGHELLVIPGDVSREDDAARMVEETVKAYGRIDVLFNNAGILIERQVHEMTEAEWDRQIGVNLKGAFFVAKHAVRQMLRNGGGVIVNTGSVNALIGDPDEAAYCASKAGVALLTKSMALAYAGRNIRVNAICPGWVETPLFAQEAENRGVTVAEYRRYAASEHPLGRIGRPEDIADLVLFLASDESAYTTGALVVADGGYTAR